MTIKELIAFVVLLGALGTMWWQLDGKINREIRALDNKIIQMDTRLYELNREMGALQERTAGRLQSDRGTPPS